MLFNKPTALKVDEKDFKKEVLQHQGFVFVEFFTDWCGACHIIAPVINEMMDKFSNQIKFVKIDHERNKTISEKYRVAKLPTIIIFKDGKIIEVIKNVIPRKVMLNKIKILLRNETTIDA